MEKKNSFYGLLLAGTIGVICSYFIGEWNGYNNKGNVISKVQDGDGDVEVEDNKFIVIDSFLNRSHHLSLMSLFESIEFPMALSDLTSKYYQHIGEAEEALVDESNGKPFCDKKYLHYDPIIRLCVFVSRVDIGLHYVFTGGHQMLKETFSRIMQRPKFFKKYRFVENDINFEHFGNDDNNSNDNNNNNNKSSSDYYHELKQTLDSVFNYSQLLENTQELCGSQYSYVRPYTTSMAMHIAGMAQPIHTDLPNFRYATRYTFPQWLLVVMQHSNLFKNERIKEIQAVIYVHPWVDDPAMYEDAIDGYGYSLTSPPHGPPHGGEFVVYSRNDVWDKDSITHITTNGGSAILTDGTSYVHGTNLFMPHKEPYFDEYYRLYNEKINFLNHIYLKFDRNKSKWILYIKDYDDNVLNEGKTLEYSWNEVRALITARLWCFGNETEADRFDPNVPNDEFTLDYVLDTLKKDLIDARGYNRDKIEAMAEYDFGLLLMDEYINYPYYSYNYCLVFKVLPEWDIMKWFECVVCDC